MCGRYRRTTSEEKIARRYHIHIPPQRDLPISWNIAPTQDVLAIRCNPKSKQRTLDILRWGLIPNWAKDPKIAYKTINARAESVDTAPSYRQAFNKRRCLIPVDGFYPRTCLNPNRHGSQQGVCIFLYYGKYDISGLHGNNMDHSQRRIAREVPRWPLFHIQKPRP